MCGGGGSRGGVPGSENACEKVRAGRRLEGAVHRARGTRAQRAYLTQSIGVGGEGEGGEVSVRAWLVQAAR